MLSMQIRATSDIKDINAHIDSCFFIPSFLCLCPDITFSDVSLRRTSKLLKYFQVEMNTLISIFIMDSFICSTEWKVCSILQ
ncbi:unnamed protein product [Heterobilharzia americana]|nr:unnamed protein product [Heterobilharzia americana]CAH8508061.1 unnamed protein product [Heterobilharzia americana]